jgi:hypothetical protein
MFIVGDKTMENHGNQLHFQKQIIYDYKSVCVCVCLSYMTCNQWFFILFYFI